jgi:branched-chain amino acid transport system permease protein
MLSQFLQQLLNGLTIGSFYALIALGYTMVYGVLKLINFAHGELFMLGGYLGMTLLGVFAGSGRLPGGAWILLPVLAVAMVVMAAVGVLLERVAYRPLRSSGRLPMVISALGASMFLQNAVMLVYGARYRVFPSGVVPERSWQIAGARITLLQVLILVTSLLLMAGLYAFVQFTRVGIAMRAVSLDHETAQLMGIDTDRIIALVFVIGPALGAAGGIMVGIYYGQVYFTVGWTYGIKAFTAAILGGIGNIPGAMLGGVLLGVLEAMASGYVSPQWQNAIAFFVLILILILLPRGILGERVAEKI